MLDVRGDLRQCYHAEVCQVTMSDFGCCEPRQARLQRLAVERDFALLKVCESGVVEISAAWDIERLKVPALADLGHTVGLKRFLVHVAQL